ncbi:MAG TPA: substrate-binding domain-containing protein [Usitatibacter sp.]|nr:substrate-binding domain-containing protein [Usitatibacter sp.]
MHTPRILFAHAALAIAGLLGFSAPVPAAEIHVMTSGGFTAAYKELTPDFERATGHKISTAYGASMGGAPDAIPSRLARGEHADIVILAAPALEALIKDGKVVPGSRVDLVHSNMGMVVRPGAAKPDISTLEAFKRAVLEAKSIAYSASASGVYLSTELFPKMGIWEQIKEKSRRIESERVAAVVARGDAEMGFQQISELLEVKAADFVGPLPEGAQRTTIFSAGMVANAKEPEAARELIRYFRSAAAAPVIKRAGLDPAPER